MREMSHQLTFKERINITDYADIECKKALEKKGVYYTKFGFDHRECKIPSKQWFKFPKMLRAAPDFIVVADKTWFVEAKGCSSSLRLKIDDYHAYDEWDGNIIKGAGLLLYIYSTDLNYGEFVVFKTLKKKILLNCYPVEQYNDNSKEYYLRPTSMYGTRL